VKIIMKPQSRESLHFRVYNSIGRHNDLDITSGRGSERISSRKKQLERDHRDNFEDFMVDARDEVYSGLASRSLASYRNRKRNLD